VAAHHGSLSRKLRLVSERKLKVRTHPGERDRLRAVARIVSNGQRTGLVACVLGENITPIVQLAPAETRVPQLLLSENP